MRASSLSKRSNHPKTSDAKSMHTRRISSFPRGYTVLILIAVIAASTFVFLVISRASTMKLTNAEKYTHQPVKVDATKIISSQNSSTLERAFNPGTDKHSKRGGKQYGSNSTLSNLLPKTSPETDIERAFNPGTDKHSKRRARHYGSNSTLLSFLPKTYLDTDISFQQLLSDIAVQNRVVFATGDALYAHMVSNLISTSIKRFSISNFFVVATQDGVCEQMERLDVKCFTYRERITGGNYGTKKFATLVNVKTEVMYAIVRSGYKVLLVDGDIVFLQNPIPILEQETNFDIQIQDDNVELNSGFVEAKPSENAQLFLGKAWSYAVKNNKRQQQAFNVMYKHLSKSRVTFNILNRREFPCGANFFERPRRMFAYESPCKDCVILHNNWIVSNEAKIYRFKEMLLWTVDSNEYYTSNTDRFIEFGNPDPHVPVNHEIQAIETAMKLGELLNRKVILPGIRCRSCSPDKRPSQGCAARTPAEDICAFHARFQINSFEKTFPYYREHLYRYNNLTNSRVRLKVDWNAMNANSGIQSLQPSPEDPFYIQCDNAQAYTKSRTGLSREIYSTSKGDVEILKFENTFGDAPRMPGSANQIRVASGSQPTEQELLQWFDNDSAATVLRFYSLYGVDFTFSDPAREHNWRQRWKAGLKMASLRQYEILKH